MSVRVAINGFGRIGRNVLRAIHEARRSDLIVVAINDLGSVATNAHLLKHDSVHGPFPGTVSVADGAIDIGAGPIKVQAERDPAKLPWRDLKVDVALECTGFFTKRDGAAKHLEAGARKVLISAPGEGVDLTVVYGVNHDKLTQAHQVISNASCTTNCLAPVAAVLNRTVGIERGFMTTVHASTLDQPVLDTLHKDLRRARAAGLSMIPTSTGAARAVGLVLPELKGKLDGTAVRVPTANVSLIDLTFTSRRPTSKDEINKIMKDAASSGPLAGILGYCDEPLVSIDFNHDAHSSTIDADETAVVDGTLCRVLAWYDNEWGFSNRMGDVAALLGRLETAVTAYRTIDGLDVVGKRVLVRVDLNVPVQDGRVTDATRIERAAPTIAELAARGAKVVVLSHFGRPKGERVPAMSLRPLVAPLSAALKGRAVTFAEDCIGPEAERVVAGLEDGEIALLENVRYHAGEEKNDPALAKQLAALGDLYVNDAFSAAHRAHASTAGIARYLPSYAGRLMQAELDALHRALGKPEHPVTAVVGGAKISTKLALLGNLIGKVDTLAVGGGMANTFLNAKGIEVGRSLCESEMADTACAILQRAKHERCRILLPSDVVIAREFKAGAATETVAATAVPRDAMILDIGPRTVKEIVDVLERSRTLVWNGPLGAFEIAPFDQGTVATARAAAELTARKQLLSVAGGGDTVAALAHAGVAERFSYVSTAGGAFLEWLEGKTLPGVAALGP